MKGAAVAAVADRGGSCAWQTLEQSGSTYRARGTAYDQSPMVLPVDFRELRSAISGEKRRANIFVRNAELLIDTRKLNKNKKIAAKSSAHNESAQELSNCNSRIVAPFEEPYQKNILPLL